jgi:hypothetical protein
MPQAFIGDIILGKKLIKNIQNPFTVTGPNKPASLISQPEVLGFCRF